MSDDEFDNLFDKIGFWFAGVCIVGLLAMGILYS